MRTTIFTVLVVLLLSAALAVAQSPISGAGTANQVAKFTAAHTIGNSAISEVSGSVGIGTTAPGFTLDVNGGINSAMGFSLGGHPFAFGSYQLLNTFLGFAGNSTVTGEENIGIGPEALEESTSGSGNLAMGFTTLYNDTDGVNNLALGTAALYWNQHGGSNVSIGGYSSYFTTGSLNVALGMNALNQNTTGSDNVAVGTYANGGNATGSSNTAIGQESGVTNQNYYPGGSHNTALGDWASFGNPSTPVNNATAIGSHALATQSNSLVLGGTGTYAVNVGIGTSTPATILQIGQCLGAALSDGWQTYSSRRYKKNIQTIGNALLEVERLRGVTYESKRDGKHEIGVIAEEVDQVVPEIVAKTKEGEVNGVDYGRLAPILIEAVKEQQKEIQEERLQISDLLSQMHQQETIIQAQAATLQALRDQLQTAATRGK